MRIKKYDNFQINESFSNSSEYTSFLVDNSLPNQDFIDSLSEVGDISNCNIQVHKMICDESGLFIKKFNSDVDYKIKYMILITFVQKKDYEFDKFSNVIDDLSTIRLSIQEMIDRAKSNNLKLDYSKVLIEGIPKTSPLEEASRTIFTIHFLGDIDNNQLKKYYQKWDNSIGDGYEKMLSELKSFYHVYDINFDNYYDTMEDEDGVNINIGVFPPSEDLHHVATYNKSNNTYQIYHDELNDSLSGWLG